ncbi:MAG: hypothetical protein IT473_04480 [Lysobacter sp.]|nr:hypothetical protein [Lysobacter sp.]
MGLFDSLKRLFSSPAPQANDEGGGFDPERFIYLKIPGNIQPIERGERFEDPLQAMLEETGLGEVSGGGSSLSDADAEGRRVVEFCGIDIDVDVRDAALERLRAFLPELSIPQGTELHYTRDGRLLRDIYADSAWTQAVPREERHPGFGV